MEIDLVLAGSGVRFGAYLGAIKALEDLGFNPTRIIGSSGGAIAGGLYASGIHIDAIINEWNMLDLRKFKKLRLSRIFKDHGLYTNEYVATRIDQLTGSMKLSKSNKEFHATATGEKFGLKIWNKDTAPDMTIGQAVQMSAAFPFFYQRVRYGQDAYSDGGWLKNYAIDYFPSDRKVIGLRVRGNKAKNRRLSKTIIGLGKNLFKVDMEQKEHEYLEDAQWAKTIEIRTGNIPMMDFKLSKYDREWLVNLGYDSVMKNKGKL